MTASLAKEARNASTVGNNRACSDRGSGKNGCSNSMLSTKGKDYPKEPLCHRCRQEEKKELLQLWEIWTYGEKL